MRSSASVESSCGYLLQELQMIWDEVGEDESVREVVLLDLEQQCQEVYRRKADNANITRAKLHQELAESESELTHLLLTLGERSLQGKPEKRTGTLKQQLESIDPILREMRLRKQDRINQFRAVKEQIQKISAEIEGRPNLDESVPAIVNENDLSLKKLEEHRSELQRFQNEKSERLQLVESYLKTVQDLSSVMEMDASMIITKIHPSLNEQCGMAKNISDTILEELNNRVESLRDEKQKRLLKLHQLGRELTDMWNLMDTPEKDRELFAHVIDLSSASPQEVNKTGSLALTIIQQAEAEVMRLDQLKASKMKELYLRKQFELEDVCARSHMEVPSKPDMDHIRKLITSGAANHDHLLKGIDDQIAKAKEEASRRKRLMAKVEKWMFARDEERWLEEYNRDENRYSVSKCVHKNLQRAERARTAVASIPALVDSLIAMTKSWEEEQKKTFIYDEVPLLVMLEEYNSLRQEKEEDKQRKRLERKKVQRQVPTEQEKLLSIRPSSGMRRISDGSLNASPGNPSPLNKKIQLHSRQQRFSNIKPPTKRMYNKQIKTGEKTHSQCDSTSHLREETVSVTSGSPHLREETVSVISTFSGPLSPHV